MRTLVFLTIPLLWTGCATRLTVQKSYPEVKAAMQEMEQKLNADADRVAQAAPTKPLETQLGMAPPTSATNALRSAEIRPTSPAVVLRPGGALSPGGVTNVLLIPETRPPKRVIGPALARESPDGTVLNLHISEDAIGFMNAIPVGHVSTTIEAKPAGPQRTKIKFISKEYGLIYDSRVREKEKQRRQDLSDILEGKPWPPENKK